MVRYYILVEGRVQGVGFRFFSEVNAYNYNLTGWVKNLENDMVVLEVQGPEDNINKFILKIKEGNRFIRVDDIHIKRKDLLNNEKTLRILY